MKKDQVIFLVRVVIALLFNYCLAGAPVPIPAVPPAVAAPVVALPGISIEQALYKAMLPTTPLFNDAGDSRLSTFTTVFSLVNSKVPMVRIQTAVQELIKLVLTPVLERTDITSQQVADTVKMVNTVIAQLGTVELTTEKPLIALLTPLKDKLTTRSAAIIDIDSKMTQAATMPDSSLSRKIEAYATLLSKVGANMLDATRQKLIQGIVSLYEVAKKGTSAQVDATKKMLPMITANNSFKQDEKHLLATLLNGGVAAPVAALTSASPATGGASPVLAAAFKYIDVDANKQPVSVSNQCQIGNNSLPLVTAVASVADKNLFITLANKLCTLYFTMNANEIGQVESLCTGILQNAYIVPSTDKILRGILQAWIQKLGAVKKVAEADKPLLKTIKNFSKSAPFDVMKGMQFLEIGINLLAGEGNIKLPPAESDVKNPASLTVAVRDLLGKVYAQRSINQPAVMTQLTQVFTSKNALSLNYISAAWQDNIAFLNKILSYQEMLSTKALQAIQDVTMLVKSLVVITPPATALPAIDSFSKGVLENLLTNIFGSRSMRAQVEIVALQNLYTECALPSYKAIFSERTQKMFKGWVADLALLNNLSSAEQAAKLPAILAALEKVKIALLGLANAAMSEERARFIKEIQAVFNRRGLWNADELGRLSVFLKKITDDKKFCTLLGAAAVEDITNNVKTIDALHRDIAVGSSGAALLDRLLEKQKDIRALTQVLELLIDEQTATKFRLEALFKALKLCVANVAQLNRPELILLLQAVVAKKIGHNSLFSASEISSLSTDIANLQKAQQ